MEHEIGIVAKTIDRVVEDPEQRAQLKAELHQVLGAAKAQRNSTDVWLARWVRPLALVFTLLLVAVTIGMQMWGPGLPQYIAEGNYTLATIVTGGYITLRGVEKAAGRFRRG